MDGEEMPGYPTRRMKTILLNLISAQFRMDKFAGIDLDKPEGFGITLGTSLPELKIIRVTKLFPGSREHFINGLGPVFLKSKDANFEWPQRDRFLHCLGQLTNMDTLAMDVVKVEKIVFSVPFLKRNADDYLQMFVDIHQAVKGHYAYLGQSLLPLGLRLHADSSAFLINGKWTRRAGEVENPWSAGFENLYVFGTAEHKEGGKPVQIVRKKSYDDTSLTDLITYSIHGLNHHGEKKNLTAGLIFKAFQTTWLGFLEHCFTCVFKLKPFSSPQPSPQ